MVDSSRPIAIVVGGGPAGALTAKVLSDRGFDVRLYESYPHPAGDDVENKMVEKSKAYVISISPRGQSALRRCGVDPMADLDAAVISEAVVRHSDGGKKARVIRPNGGKYRSVVVRRRALAASLLRAAEKSGAEVHCGWRVTDVDFERRVVTLAEGTEKEEGGGAGKKELTVSYDLLVGADGVRSRTRTLLSNHLNEKGEDFNVKTIDDTMEYQVAILPRPWKEIVRQEILDAGPLGACPPASTHAWADTKAGSTAFGFPLRKSNQSPIDSLLVTVIFPGGVLGEMKESGFAGYSSALSALFSDWTADSRLDLARLLAMDDNRPSTGGVCVWSKALSHPESGVVLIGDAGHGMWPSLGQGCNAALESVSVFADAVEAVMGSVSSGAGCRNIDFSSSSKEELVRAIALEYDGLRRDDALAAVDLSYGGMGGTNVRGAPHSPTAFKIQILLFMALNKLTAGLVPMPAMMRMMESDVRYSTLKRAIALERYVMYGTIVGILGFSLSRLL